MRFPATCDLIVVTLMNFFFINIFCSTGNQGSLGLIVDWLELLDPEVTSLASALQDKLLFGRLTQPQTGTGTKATAGPAYLRSLLTHQTRWSTIRQTIDRLLSTDDVTQWSPTAVLDFLTVCLSNPRLYQGREQKKPKVCYSMTPHSSP